MRKAARAIIIHNGRILVMYRNKNGSEYFTLVGGRAGDNETPDQTLGREVYEETGLKIRNPRFVYYEGHPEPYNEQFIYLCDVDNPDEMALQEWSEEGVMNRMGANMHKPMWVDINAFDSLPFRTPQLQDAIVKALKKGFPEQPVSL